MTRFDQLFAKVAGPYDSAQGLVEKLSVERTRGQRLKGITAFRKLRQDARIRAAQDFLKRKRPKTAQEAFEAREAKFRAQQPLRQAFLWDGYYSGVSIYDAAPGEYLADVEDGRIVWRVRHPFTSRKALAHHIKSLTDVPPALIRLAQGIKRAFKVTLEDVQKTFVRYGLVLMPKGDRRAERLADKPEHAVEIDGLTCGTALLFERSNPEQNGIIAQYGPEGNGPYGMSVWGTFYCIEIEAQGFEREPSI